ncbi:Periplasmic oligopeptide-binding protein [Usitatibacter rugosus]|uniref:Periplasmic oligopeptide-binding protein n=1 Tax=Usitatibacter rugosus TaxID=2732067 RepID=A0A6M4GZ19_9PROT|nr:ABC transporter substrate-binding protein [Usitatibacter rugosus]QJR11663.1 Periplasmic oligopeptide-binding protein [Usitatibacter rugosus]
MKRLPFAVLALATLLATAHPALSEPKKVLRMAFRTAETGFDPQKVFDRYSVGICESLFEPLLTYDYLARPVKVVPLTAEAVPQPEEGGTRYTFRIKPGIYFADDPAFKGKKRELTAQDVAYSIRRFRDPKLASPYEWLFENKLIGLDELAEKAKKTGTLDMDTPIPGIEVRDRYTVSFKLKEPDFNFAYVLAMPNVVPVAREVVELYPDDMMGHPVGTGPFVLKEWVRRSKIVLEKNPNHRGYELDVRYADPNDPWDKAAIEALRGKRLPNLDRVEIYPIEEEQPRYLAFVNREHDILDETPFEFIEQILPNGKLAPALAKQGVRVFREEAPETTYDLFNIDDPTLGGYTPEKVALRRAMVLAHDRDQEVGIVRKGQANAAQTPVPPGVVGFDPAFLSHQQDHDPARAKALLDMFGYVDSDGDGWRDLPGGKPLRISYKYNTGSQEQRQLALLWVKSMAEIGIRVDAAAVQFADLLQDKRVGKFQMASSAWTADYPDAQNFLQLLYGPNTGQSNEARFKLPEYDRTYEKSQRYPDSPERNALYRDMSRLILAYAPWRLGVHRVFNHLQYPWVKAYKKHPILYTNFKYLDIDVAEQQAATKK